MREMGECEFCGNIKEVSELEKKIWEASANESKMFGPEFLRQEYWLCKDGLVCLDSGWKGYNTVYGGAKCGKSSAQGAKENER